MFVFVCDELEKWCLLLVCLDWFYLLDHVSHIAICFKVLYNFPCVHVCSYLATRHYPVSDGEKRQPNGDPEHCPALHSDGLLPQTREVLVPDSEQLLLTIGMSNKLHKNTGIRNTGHQRNMWKKLKAEDMKIGKIKEI